ncbi:hypothetical protein H0H87_006969 [Tephrocybe sp. NHM501043]|nr:hypothetical protein H0H87_006969 [Tephrocybe sp. NHM501043]
MSPPPFPTPEISVLQPTEAQISGGRSDEGPFTKDCVEFLDAQTRPFRRDRLAPAKESINWDPDDYVVSAAADCKSPLVMVSSNSIGNDEMGKQIYDICVSLNNIFRDRKRYIRFLDHRGDAAQDLLDLLQKLLDHAPLDAQFRSILYVALVRLCRKSELCPRCFSIEGIYGRDEWPVSAGAYGEVYKAYLNEKVVCLKVVKLYQNSDRAQRYKAFSREAITWGQLVHPNVLPFYGIHDTSHRLCLVSPWIPNGNIHSFLKAQPNANRPCLIYGAASGMRYLHDQGVVHGDLKSLNILVTESGQACLTDFGFSYVTNTAGINGHELSSLHAEGGTPGFEAPELADPANESGQRTPASDVFAFGMIFTGQRPFGDVHLVTVILNIIQGRHPSRPSEALYVDRGLTDAMWGLMKSCWSFRAAERPSAAQIMQQLPPTVYEANTWARFQRPAFETSDITIAQALPHLQTIY